MATYSFSGASIGAIDDFYDLYVEIQNIYESVVNKRIETRGNLKNYTPLDWDNDARKEVRKVSEPIMQKYLPVFLDGTSKIYANAWGFLIFTLLDFSHEHGSSTIKCRYISFSNFLVEFEKAIIRIIHNRRRKERPGIEFETVQNEINDHIEKYVDEHNLIKTYISSDLSVQNAQSELYIYQNLSTIGCRIKHHSIIPTSFVADFASGEGKILLPVHYCEDCNKYFIGQTTLALFEKKYGKVLVKKHLLGKNEIYANLNEESILFQLGYNVSDGRTEMERQQLLVLLLEKKRVSYLEMVRCLESNIRLHSNQQEAVIKWKRDLKYISDYILEKDN